MHFQRLFLLYVAVFQFWKKVLELQLPCIEAHTELSSTFIDDWKISTSGSSERNSHLSQGGRIDYDAHVCEPICINMYCGAKHNNQEKTIHLLKEGNSVHRHGHHCRWSPLGEVRISSSQNCHSCSFCSHKQRCWTVLSELKAKNSSKSR